MTIHKATTIMQALTTTKQISNHGVRKFWIYWTLHLLRRNSWKLGLPVDYHNYHRLSKYFDSDKRTAFFSNKGGKLVDFMEYSRYFQDLLYPSQGTQAMLTQETKKV